jgi:hypothetical protein
MKIIRHGDLIFRKLDLKDLIKKGKKVSQIVLALGEHTGHKHLLQMDKNKFDIECELVLIELNASRAVFNVKKGGAILTHEEHKPVTFSEGIWEMTYERERDPFLDSIRQVLD